MAGFKQSNYVWAGGIGLAKYIKEHPEVVKGKSVLDVASGTGLVADEAKAAGAASVFVNDIDPSAPCFQKHEGVCSDFSTIDPSGFDVVLMADLWWFAPVKEPALAWVEKYSPKLITSTVRMPRPNGKLWHEPLVDARFTSITTYDLTDLPWPNDSAVAEVEILEM